MSDDDFMQESDEEYDFEYEDEDEADADHVDIENKYYTAKQLKVTDPEDALVEFLSIPAMEETKGEWGFKGLKQAIKMEFGREQYDKAIEHYNELLTYVTSAVSRNYSEKSISNMLDYVDKGADRPGAGQCVEKFYSLTLKTFQATNNDRLWLKTSIKLAKLMLDRKDYTGVAKKLREIQQKSTKDGTDDPSKGTYALELCALEIQMHAELKNDKQLKRLYQRALTIKSAVPHPNIMGIIRECGGKMHMSEENWVEAQSDFFESFRNYDEAGSLQRIQVLKYLILSTMLMKSDISPFDSQETKPYKTDPRITAMTELVDAFQRDDVRAYEDVLQRNLDLLADPFIAENIDEVTRNMRTKGLVKLVAPYSRMRLDWIARHLRLPIAEACNILGYLISDGRLQGKIDEREGTLNMASDPDLARVQAISDMAVQVRSMAETLLHNAPGFKAIELYPPEQDSTLHGAGFAHGGKRKAKGMVDSMWM